MSAGVATSLDRAVLESRRRPFPAHSAARPECSRSCETPSTSGALVSAGVAALVPNWLALAAVVATVVGGQLVVRLEEEPYLQLVHGHHYLRYEARTRRFLPRIK
jgi:hypothetical protein